MLPKFEIYTPKDVDDSLRFLDEKGQDAKILAGGTDLLLRMRGRKLKPEWVVNVSGLKELSYIKSGGGKVRIGALTTISELADSEVLAERYAAFREVAKKFGGPHTRNMATIGGNVARSLQTSDLILPLLALDAEATIRSVKGERRVPVADLLVKRRKTTLEPNEIITEFSFKDLSDKEHCAFEKLGRRKSQALTIAAACVYLKLGDNDKIEDVKVAVDELSKRRVPERSKKAESHLKGKVWSEELVAQAEEAMAGEMQRRGDFRASAEYRKDMSKVLFRRALKRCRETIKTT